MSSLIIALRRGSISSFYFLLVSGNREIVENWGNDRNLEHKIGNATHVSPHASADELGKIPILSIDTYFLPFCWTGVSGLGKLNLTNSLISPHRPFYSPLVLIEYFSPCKLFRIELESESEFLHIARRRR